MHLVCAHPPGALIGIHRSLTASERNGLIAHFRGGPLTAMAADLLRWLWRVHLWIACDCRGRGGAPPVLFVRQTAGTEFVLATMADRPAHHSQCPFAGPPSARATLESVTEMPPLATLMFRWFSAARLNVLYPYEGADLLHSQFGSLREASKSLEIARGRCLFDHSRTHPVGLPGLMRQLSQAESRPCGVATPPAIYFNTVPALTTDALRTALQHPTMAWGDGVPLDTLRRVTRLPSASSDQGPHAVLYGFEWDCLNARARVAQIFAHPIFSRSQLVLLNGSQERRTLAILLSVQRELLRSQHLVVAIRKTLPDTPIHERGIAFQVQTLGPNGRASRTFDVLSVDCGAAPQDAFTIASDADLVGDQAVHEHARRQHTLYHFVQAPTQFKSDRHSLAHQLMECLLDTAAGPEGAISAA